MWRKSETWSYNFCETCLKNSHEKVKMVREKILATDRTVPAAAEMWCCPACGSTKRL